jgi:hypothetical protein
VPAPGLALTPAGELGPDYCYTTSVSNGPGAGLDSHLVIQVCVSAVLLRGEGSVSSSTCTWTPSATWRRCGSRSAAEDDRSAVECRRPDTNRWADLGPRHADARRPARHSSAPQPHERHGRVHILASYAGLAPCHLAIRQVPQRRDREPPSQPPAQEGHVCSPPLPVCVPPTPPRSMTANEPKAHATTPPSEGLRRGCNVILAMLTIRTAYKSGHGQPPGHGGDLARVEVEDSHETCCQGFVCYCNWKVRKWIAGVLRTFRRRRDDGALSSSLPCLPLVATR